VVVILVDIDCGIDLTQNARPERRFELVDDGALVAWEQRSPGVWTDSPPRS